MNEGFPQEEIPELKPDERVVDSGELPMPVEHEGGLTTTDNITQSSIEDDEPTEEPRPSPAGDGGSVDSPDDLIGLENKRLDTTEVEIGNVTSLDELLTKKNIDPRKLSAESEADKLRRQELERANEAERRKRERYSRMIDDIGTKVRDYKKEAMDRLASDIDSGSMTREGAEDTFAKIEKDSKRAARFGFIYNHSNDPKYYRSQEYVAFVDDEGHIWGDFADARRDYGQPMPPGVSLVHENPDKPVSFVDKPNLFPIVDGKPFRGRLVS